MRKAKITKCSWQDIRGSVARVNPKLAECIDNISPDPSYSLYLAKYPYGAEIINTGQLQIPNRAGQLVRLNSSEISSEMQEDIGYNLGTNPVSLIMDKSAEIFYSTKSHTIPFALVPSGSVISTWKVLSDIESHQPAFLWNMTAGARSIFMLPKISEYGSHDKVRRKFKVTSEKPRSLFHHWAIFRDIANHQEFESEWNFQILFFGKKWFDNIDDEIFKEFKLCLLNSAWRGSNYFRNQFIWELVFSLIKEEYDLRVEPYIIETVNHLLAVGVGGAPGFAPAMNDVVAPVAGIAKVYEDVYQIKQYSPVIMQPTLYDYNNTNNDVYYSLQYPTAQRFSPRRGAVTKINDIFHVKNTLSKYIESLQSNKYNTVGTPIAKLCDNTVFDFYHSGDNLLGIQHTSEIFEDDMRFSQLTANNKDFPITSPFLRGCVRFRAKGEVAADKLCADGQ